MENTVITLDQCRAARALVRMSQLGLADAAGISNQTVVDFERGVRKPHPNNLAAIRAALEAAGVVFIPGTATTGPGVHLRDPPKK